MPFISMKTNVSISPAKQGQLQTKLGKAIELLPGKTEKWLMLSFEDEKKMAFAGSNDPCAILCVTVYGKGTSDAYQNLTQAITAMVHDELLIPVDRIYVAYAESEYWGWAGNNF